MRRCQVTQDEAETGLTIEMSASILAICNEHSLGLLGQSFPLFFVVVFLLLLWDNF